MTTPLCINCQTPMEQFGVSPDGGGVVQFRGYRCDCGLERWEPAEEPNPYSELAEAALDVLAHPAKVEWIDDHYRRHQQALSRLQRALIAVGKAL